MDNYNPGHNFQNVEEVIDFGWKVLDRIRKANHVHVSEKELFFAGAGFLFDTIVRAMSTGRNPTPSDQALIAKISEEMLQFNGHFNLKFQRATKPN